MDSESNLNSVQSSSNGSNQPPTNKKQILVQTLKLYAVTIILCAVLWQLRPVIPFIRNNLHALIAALFLYLPTGLIIRRKEDFSTYGLTWHPLLRNIKIYLLGVAIVFPLFTVGFFYYYRMICHGGEITSLLPHQLASLCQHFINHWQQLHWRLPPDFSQMVLAQLLVVALPEEYFFRGYIQTRLEMVWPSRRYVLGQPVGYSLVGVSFFFALGHVLVDFNVLRMAVFFPALAFGWMRQATGSILAGVLFHASCNLLSEVLHHLFFL